MKPVKALKEFFESHPHGRKITMDELKALDKPERHELAAMCGEALGVEIEFDPAAEAA